jgi:hypothetical protein
MPPRFPHGLKKNPIHMNHSEKAVFAMLGTSILAGLLHLATSPLYNNNNTKNNLSGSGSDTSHENGDGDGTNKSKQKPYVFQL